MIAAGLLVTLWVNSCAAGFICPVPLPRPMPEPIPIPGPMPGPTEPGPVDQHPLMGTEYRISGLNSLLPEPTRPATVKFDGTSKVVGSYIVTESLKHIVNDDGDRETWADFEFTLRPVVFRGTVMAQPPYLASIPEDGWRVSLSDFELSENMKFPEFYMYFTENGTPAPFGSRTGRRGPEPAIGEHPFLDDVSVYRGSLEPVDPIDLPPGAKNGLVTQYQHYFTAVHDVDRGMGVPLGVTGFHLGYRVTCPEPASCVLGMFAAVGSCWVLRRRRLSIGFSTGQ